MPEEFRTPEVFPQMSFSDKFVGILSSPGEVYDYVAKLPEKQNSNWMLPLIIATVLAIIYTFVVFTQPPIQDQMHDAQLKAMQKSVADGKMTQEQMDRAMEMNPAKPGSPMFLIFGSVGVVFVMVVMLLVYSAVYWLGGKLILKMPTPYYKITEVFGLSFFIVAIGTLISMGMAVGMGSLYAQPALSLAVSNFDPMNKTHKLLAAVNVIEFWQMYVIGVGLSKVWTTSLVKALGIVGSVWAIWTLIKVFANFGFGM
ncbi:MAG: hypothetical protein PHP42_05585 [Bacteroidota bacterium]|nr:hypothetical protein [Bacteroidota bacterium]